MNDPNLHIHDNLSWLRRANHLTIEEVAGKIGVSRQAVSKWEAGETVPDILNCDALAALYDVSVDDLLHHDRNESNSPIAPKGKYIFGTVKIGERGQVVIPKQARDKLNLKIGDQLVVLVDETPGSQGVALVPSELFLETARQIMENFTSRKDGD